jgi:hypothetical protein
MSAPTTCPKCGAHSPTGVKVCGCGYDLSVLALDIGKPLRTAYPVSRVCPACGSGEYKTVQPKTMVAFTRDRVCRACSTRYTPPTPMWARVLFGVCGIGFVAICLLGLHRMIYVDGFVFTRPVGLVMVFIVGLGCLYKAATK